MRPCPSCCSPGESPVSPDSPDNQLEPEWPKALALSVFIAAALTLCWPMLGGGFLLGDDQYVASYSFRLYGAEMFRETGHIPQWNPYLFCGLPFIAAMHGDIFYPTAWLRWILPVDTAMNLGFAIHLVLAGFDMYLLLRALGASWAASSGPSWGCAGSLRKTTAQAAKANATSRRRCPSIMIAVDSRREDLGCRTWTQEG